ncbi:hypothetical protein WCX49_11895 [Sulfurimonas sp. HSL-1656]|uniref:hypothetical protein n=1 Tax=Thiomicrolovo subterrani TaxID=3131934 RepID=UPI0031FA2571
MELMKRTSLEKTDDVAETLTWKIATINEKGLPVESSLADYIALALRNVDGELAYLKDIKSQISDREKFMKAQAEKIKLGGAAFMLENGLEKLEGEICSSITVTAAKEATETEVTEEVFTLLVDEAEAQELLIALGKAEMRKVTKTKTTEATPAKIKVNQRRVAKAEVVESIEAA